MLALILGLICGAAEFVLLQRYINATMAGKISTALCYIVIKLFLLLGTLLLSVLLWKKQMIATAVGIVIPLVVGAVARICMQNIKRRKGSDTSAD